MKTWFLAAALLAPMLTFAQEAPPPAYQQGQQRDTWYIGFGLGTGNGSAAGQGSSFTFKELNGDRDTTNVFLNFKVGATMSPKLLLGLDISAVRSAADSNGVASAVQVTNYDAVVTFFPMERGLFLRGGVGLSKLTYEVDGFNTTTTNGGNVLVGAGYAFWLGQKFNLTVNLDLSAQSYGSSNDKPESSKMWALWLGADWY